MGFSLFSIVTKIRVVVGRRAQCVLRKRGREIHVGNYLFIYLLLDAIFHNERGVYVVQFSVRSRFLTLLIRYDFAIPRLGGYGDFENSVNIHLNINRLPLKIDV